MVWLELIIQQGCLHGQSPYRSRQPSHEGILGYTLIGLIASNPYTSFRMRPTSIQ